MSVEKKNNEKKPGFWTNLFSKNPAAATGASNHPSYPATVSDEKRDADPEALGLESADQQNPPTTIALMDVDHTIIGNAAVDLENIKETLKPAINSHITSTLNRLKVKHLYLFTDMSLTSIGLNERTALVKLLEEQGFVVHGVITPVDRAWRFNSEENLTNFANNPDLQLSDGSEEELRHMLSTNNAYQLAKEQIEKENVSSNLGIAFKSATTPEGRADLETASKGRRCKLYLDALSLDRGLTHVKGEMFRDFLKHKAPEFQRCIVFDDNREALEGVRSVAVASSLTRSIRTVIVHVNNSIRLKEGEERKTAADYVSEINAATLTATQELHAAICDVTLTEDDATFTDAIKLRIKAALVDGADINGANTSLSAWKGDLPLHTALVKRNKTLIQFLIECGADPSLREPRRGERPIERFIRVGRNQVDLLRWLLDHYPQIIETQAPSRVAPSLPPAAEVLEAKDGEGAVVTDHSEGQLPTTTSPKESTQTPSDVSANNAPYSLGTALTSRGSFSISSAAAAGQPLPQQPQDAYQSSNTEFVR